MSNRLLTHVEAQLDELVQRYQRLETAHDKLCQKEQEWLSERARLVEKHELARTRIESMIARLKQIETDAQ